MITFFVVFGEAENEVPHALVGQVVNGKTYPIESVSMTGFEMDNSSMENVVYEFIAARYDVGAPLGAVKRRITGPDETLIPSPFVLYEVDYDGEKPANHLSRNTED